MVSIIWIPMLIFLGIATTVTAYRRGYNQGLFEGMKQIRDAWNKSIDREYWNWLFSEKEP